MPKDSVINKLEQKIEQVRSTAELLMSATRDWQVIKEYLTNRTNDLELTPEQSKKLDRYQFVYNQLVSGKYTTQKVVNMLKQQYSIGVTQAYEDIRNSKEIFNSVININKIFELNIELEINRQMIAEARAIQDYRSASALEKNRIAMLASIHHEEENPAEYFEGHIINPVFNPELIGAKPIDLKEVLRIINEKRDIKLDIQQITDLPFEEVKNDDTTAL